MINQKFKVISLLAVLITLSHFASAQQEFTLYHMPVLSQSTMLNSAAIPEHKVSISLPIPSVFVGFNNSAFSVKALMDKNGTVDYGKFVEGLSKNKNYIGFGANVELFHLRIMAANNFFSAQSRVVNDIRFLFPKDLLGLGAEGVRDGFSLSGLGIHANSYLEHSLGFTRVRPDSRWTYGGKLKLLKGITNIQTKSSEIELVVDDQDLYNYDLSANLELNVGVGLNKSRFASFDDITNINVENYKDAKEQVQLSTGFAMDAAATFQASPKISFAASLNNLGYINWKSFTKNYKGSTTFEFDGVQINDLDFSQNLDSLISNQLDSTLTALTDLSNSSIDTTANPYKAALPANLFLTAHFQLSPRARASASLYSEFFNGLSLGAVAGLNISVTRRFDFTASWWWFRKSSTNLGLGMVYKPGPFQFYMVMDNVLPASFVKINDAEKGIENLWLPYQVKNFNMRIGMNLVFGRIKAESRLSKSGLTKKKHGIKRYTYKPSNK